MARTTASVEHMALRRNKAIEVIGLIGVVLVSAALGWQFGESTYWRLLPGALQWISLTLLCCAVAVRIFVPAVELRWSNRGATLQTAVIVFVCCGAVANTPRENTAQDRVAGVIPYSDAESYYDVIASWPVPEVDAFNARRPVNAAVLAFESALVGGGLRDVLLLRAAILSVGISLLGIAVVSSVGPLAASATCAVILQWTLPYAASCLTESTGIATASVAVALALFAWDRRSRYCTIGAVLAIASAWMIRPGNPAFPPAIAAFAAWWWLEARWKWLTPIASAALCLLLMIAIPPMMTSRLGSPGSEANSNMSHVVLGIAAGTGWKEAETLVAEEVVGLTESAQSSVRYKRALEVARVDPWRCAKGLMDGIVDSVDAPVGLAAQFGQSLRLGRGWGAWMAIIVLVSATAIGAWRRHPIACLSALAILAYLIGAVALWESGRWRACAVLFPFLALSIATVPLALTRARPSCAVRHTSDASQHSAQHAAGILIATIPLLACIYAVATAGTQPVSQGDPACWIRMDFRDQPAGTGFWTGPNSAQVSAEDLVTWARRHQLRRLADFVAMNSATLMCCRRVLGGYVIEVEGGSAISLPVGPIDYSFRVEQTNLPRMEN